LHRERGERVRGGRRAVGSGHGHRQRAVETVATGPGAVDRRRPGHGRGDPGHRPVAGHVAGQRARVRGRCAHVLRSAARLRVGRGPAQDRRVRRGRGQAAHDPAARDHAGGRPPAAGRPVPGARRRGRPRVLVLHVPAQRLRVLVGRVVPGRRGARRRVRGGRQAGGHARAGLGRRHQRVLPDVRRRHRRVGVGREPAAGRAQLHGRPPQLPVPDADRRGGRLAEHRVDGRVQLRRVHRRQRRLHRSQDAVATPERRCRRLQRDPAVDLA